MELKKRKYSKKEVAEMTATIEREYEEQISALKARVAELIRDNDSLSAEIGAYKSKDGQISDAIKRAVSYSFAQKEKVDLQYALAVEKISAFLDKWQAYFDHLKEKYPMYPVVQEAAALKSKIAKIIGEKDNKTVIFTADKEISGVKNAKPAFNPKEKIADYIAATDDSGFNMDEVLNPGALRLEDLCKELGLLTENE